MNQQQKKYLLQKALTILNGKMKEVVEEDRAKFEVYSISAQQKGDLILKSIKDGSLKPLKKYTDSGYYKFDISSFFDTDKLLQDHENAFYAKQKVKLMKDSKGNYISASVKLTSNVVDVRYRSANVHTQEAYDKLQRIVAKMKSIEERVVFADSRDALDILAELENF